MHSGRGTHTPPVHELYQYIYTCTKCTIVYCTCIVTSLCRRVLIVRLQHQSQCVGQMEYTQPYYPLCGWLCDCNTRLCVLNPLVHLAIPLMVWVIVRLQHFSACVQPMVHSAIPPTVWLRHCSPCVQPMVHSAIPPTVWLRHCSPCVQPMGTFSHTTHCVRVIVWLRHSCPCVQPMCILSNTTHCVSDSLIATLFLTSWSPQLHKTAQLITCFKHDWTQCVGTQWGGGVANNVFNDISFRHTSQKDHN